MVVYLLNEALSVVGDFLLSLLALVNLGTLESLHILLHNCSVLLLRLLLDDLSLMLHSDLHIKESLGLLLLSLAFSLLPILFCLLILDLLNVEFLVLLDELLGALVVDADCSSLLCESLLDDLDPLLIYGAEFFGDVSFLLEDAIKHILRG